MSSTCCLRVARNCLSFSPGGHKIRGHPLDIALLSEVAFEVTTRSQEGFLDELPQKGTKIKGLKSLKAVYFNAIQLKIL